MGFLFNTPARFTCQFRLGLRPQSPATFVGRGTPQGGTYLTLYLLTNNCLGIGPSLKILCVCNDSSDQTKPKIVSNLFMTLLFRYYRQSSTQQPSAPESEQRLRVRRIVISVSTGGPGYTLHQTSPLTSTSVTQGYTTTALVIGAITAPLQKVRKRAQPNWFSYWYITDTFLFR